MSKHIGNVIAPSDVLDKQGADAVRWYFYSASSPWLPSRFSGEAVSEYQRKFMGTLWNTYAFYILYAELDQFDPTKHSLKKEALSVMDRWILSRMNTLVSRVDEHLDAIRITEASRELSAFADELSNWYVRRCRDRYWGSEMSDDKEAAYMTLYTVLKTVTLLAAPFLPFMTEAMYQNMVRSVDESAQLSVHLCDYPVCDESFIDAELEAEMDRILKIVVLGRSARNGAGQKIRQPLRCMYVQGDPITSSAVDIIAEELNLKKVEFVSDASAFLSYRCKPQLRTLGPRYGKLLPKLNAYLAQDGVGDAIVAAHQKGESYVFELEGTEVVLHAEDVLVSAQQKEGLVSETDNGVTVVLDTNLDDALIEEGLVREVVSKLQTMRKEAGFEVADRIVIGFMGDAKLCGVIEANRSSIADDTLGVEVRNELDGYTKEWNINGSALTLSVKKANR